MKNKPDLEVGDEGERIAAQAAEWLVARDRGMGVFRRQRFERWLRADIRHATVYAEMVQTWRVMGLASAPLSEIPRVAKQTRIRQWCSIGLVAAAAALAVGYLGAWRVRHTTYSATVSTQVGGQDQIKLPDGSMVQLNTDSEVQVRFTPDERRVLLLRGEAHFAVAKNPSRPFFVFAGGMDVRAVGTEFDVRLRKDFVDVLVTEGKVRLEKPAQTSVAQPFSTDRGTLAFLVAGEKASLPFDAKPSKARTDVEVISMPPDAMAQALAWRVHQLQFSTETLEEVVEEFNRYNVHRLKIDDPSLAAKRFGGTFPANDPQGFVELLKKEFGVVADSHADLTVLRGKR